MESKQQSSQEETTAAAFTYTLPMKLTRLSGGVGGGGGRYGVEEGEQMIEISIGLVE